MTERDTDFEFDFFEEPSTQETATGARAVRRGPRRPMRPPAGLTPLLRLIGLIAFAILVVVLLVFWIQGCREEDERNAYADYMGDVSGLARESDGIGDQLNKVLTTPGIKQAELESQLNGLAQSQQQLVRRAQGLDPPGRLRGQHRALVEALQFRVSGLRGLEDAFRRTARSDDEDGASRLLAAQARRLVASDVIWDDLFKVPAVEELKRQDVTGVQVPGSNFLAVPDLASSNAMKPIWLRVHGARTGGTPTGIHGNGIVSVKVLPAGTELSQSEETTINATSDLAFEVLVENSGSSQEVQVPVTLTIQKTPRSIVRKQTIDLINSGEQKVVTFRNLPEPPFGNPTSVKVEVDPVRGEKNTANNTAEYPVIFSLG
jgi:hypothetical protein